MAGNQEKKAACKLIAAQWLVVICGAASASQLGGLDVGLSVVWGGMTASVNVVLLVWRMLFGDRPTFNAQQHLRLMYRSSMERFFVVAAMLAVGMLKLKLNPLAVLLGFFVGQVTLVIIPIIRGIKVK